MIEEIYGTHNDIAQPLKTFLFKNAPAIKYYRTIGRDVCVGMSDVRGIVQSQISTCNAIFANMFPNIFSVIKSDFLSKFVPKSQICMLVIFLFPYNPPTPPAPTNPPPVPPRKAEFCPISAPFGSVSAPFGSVWLRLAPFRVCFGSVSDPFRGVGWVGVGSGRGASVREKNITNVCNHRHAFKVLKLRQ